MERPFTADSKSLNHIENFLGVPISNIDLPVTGLTNASSEVEAGDIFLAFAGAKTHGANFAQEAHKRGAVAMLTDSEGSRVFNGLPIIVVDNPRRVAGGLSAWFYGEPMRDLFSVGITGTNGKTTTTTLLHQIWTLAGREAGLIGTVETRIGKDILASKHTTPESAELQALVASMKERHVTNLAMEVSSHAIALDRIRGAHFSIVGFTNLSQDHLDFHSTLEEYFSVKRSLFAFEYAGLALINIDDSHGMKLAQNLSIPYQSLSRKDVTADWNYVHAIRDKRGYEIAIRGTGGILINSFLPLLGSFNLDNALMAIAIACESGVDPLLLETIIPKLTGARGRLEEVFAGQNFGAYVDYAHTPDAVARVLEACAERKTGRVIGVLGCGGDRDSSKRPLMGRELLNGCDIAVFTSDNPRSENPNAILEAMTSGLSLAQPHAVIEDRRKAIAYAISQASPGDIVIVMGKGHESGQEIAGVIHEFDDRAVLAEEIANLK
ncbi:MAG: UDP-N-acetylmuramoyl-L-alanyl-D-glutamate--2,6-diaminopimelate ligase [Actinobacteria bacterium]|uniref:Unannotated protein n=1 Tax=freshwater metagenome TaxID=449393 RepID=A0A6J7CSU3_9ZZZZ|nr:UDP-N-acetylmuramoyl-L-alanyl-D-glutamate--2,6-diaminopimelate ligase [Actinomycetota bacterium]MSX24613.1 UDP-N-acetylmuramoyl-L-alanyl-D-glutamate--2,6-diaminopimelate ligase [Actinomycetota bacterium]MSY57694.1 UDP-N-acetylmuramoyl-L-alanyl-D-glutamate--2,6-diaminopimelate ligase [Actinomycetota bacterium]MTA99952.1 UDP-N-acetylmuramoyl-L-alanyl-D-glutamate--2,6-diaminopimelate ligase [Actinomycetota bacterium]